MKKKDIKMRILSLVRVSATTGCWTWKTRIARRYITISYDGHHEGAHRVSYRAFRGEFSTDLTIDHLCRNTRCMNAWHMEPVPLLENIHRGNGMGAVNGRKTHCKRGHEFTPENTSISGGYRQCLQCSREYAQVWHKKNPDKALASRMRWRNKNRDVYREVRRRAKRSRKIRLVKGPIILSIVHSLLHHAR